MSNYLLTVKAGMSKRLVIGAISEASSGVILAQDCKLLADECMLVEPAVCLRFSTWSVSDTAVIYVSRGGAKKKEKQRDTPLNFLALHGRILRQCVDSEPLKQT